MRVPLETTKSGTKQRLEGKGIWLGYSILSRKIVLHTQFQMGNQILRKRGAPQKEVWKTGASVLPYHRKLVANVSTVFIIYDLSPLYVFFILKTFQEKRGGTSNSLHHNKDKRQTERREKKGRELNNEYRAQQGWSSQCGPVQLVEHSVM